MWDSSVGENTVSLFSGLVYHINNLVISSRCRLPGFFPACQSQTEILSEIIQSRGRWEGSWRLVDDKLKTWSQLCSSPLMLRPLLYRQKAKQTWSLCGRFRHGYRCWVWLPMVFCHDPTSVGCLSFVGIKEIQEACCPSFAAASTGSAT